MEIMSLLKKSSSQGSCSSLGIGCYRSPDCKDIACPGHPKGVFSEESANLNHLNHKNLAGANRKTDSRALKPASETIFFSIFLGAVVFGIALFLVGVW